MTGYRLVNPYIGGTIQTTVTAADGLEAAEKIWGEISQHILNKVPVFGLSLENTGNNNLEHYIIRESSKGKSAEYNISAVNLNLSREVEGKLVAKSNEVHAQSQHGGKHHKRYEDDSSSSSSTTEEVFKRLKLLKQLNTQQPIYYWWYVPDIYLPKVVDTLFVPTFTTYRPYAVAPYIELATSFGW